MPSLKPAFKNEAIQVLQNIANQEKIINSGRTSDGQFEKYIGMLQTLGFVKTVSTPEGMIPQITELGARLLKEYQEIGGYESERGTGNLDFVVVMPALNEATAVGSTIDEVRAALEGLRFDILLVDGRSVDGTDTIASQMGARVIYQKNFGYGDALRTGFLYAKRNMRPGAIVMMDVDSTYDPRDIPKLVEAVLTGDADMVMGNRLAGSGNGAMSHINRFGNQILSWVARRTLGLNIHDTQCGLRAFRTELIDCMDLYADGMPFATEMIVDVHSAKGRIIELPVAYRPRRGRTKLSPMKDGLRIMGTIIRLIRDTKPLLFFGLSASVSGLIGLILGAFVALEWANTGTIRRLPTVMLAVLLLIGASQLFTVGLVADMIKQLRRRDRAQE
jgi:dolichol-phosphate mannosyltransferase